MIVSLVFGYPQGGLLYGTPGQGPTWCGCMVPQAKFPPGVWLYGTPDQGPTWCCMVPQAKVPPTVITSGSLLTWLISMTLRVANEPHS